MNIFQELKTKFLTGEVLTRLLFINCAMFVTALTLDITFTLFSFGEDKLAFTSLNYPWNPLLLLLKPWTPITSLFTSW